MLTNLVLNARDALPAAGGNIVVSLDVIRFDPLSSDSWQIRDVPYLRIRDSDDGTGMDEITQSRIFEPFFTTKPAGKGTGLGLSVVFGLMKLIMALSICTLKWMKEPPFPFSFRCLRKPRCLPTKSKPSHRSGSWEKQLIPKRWRRSRAN